MEFPMTRKDRTEGIYSRREVLDESERRQYCLIQLKEKHPVLHVLEWLANQVDGEDRRQRFRRRANETRGDVRIVQC